MRLHKTQVYDHSGQRPKELRSIKIIISGKTQKKDSGHCATRTVFCRRAAIENFLGNFGSVNAMVTKVQNLKESMRGTYRQNIGDSCKEHYIRLSVKQLLKVLLLELNF